MEQLLTETLSTPVEDAGDLVVVGAGSTGVAAALAAARLGLRTTLIDPASHAGGTLVSGIPILGYHDGKRQVVAGIADEIVRELHRHGGTVDDPAQTTAINVDVEKLKFVLLNLLEGAGVKLRLHTLVAGVRTEEGRITHVIVEGKGGRRALAARWFIDATGDADIAMAAGVPIEKGRKRDGKMQPMTLMFGIGGIDKKAFQEWGGYRRMTELWKGMSEKFRNPRKQDFAHFWGPDSRSGEWAFNATRVLAADGSDSVSLSAAEAEGRRQVFEMVDEFLRPHVPGFENAFVSWTAPKIGVRETRRIVGAYTLNPTHLMQTGWAGGGMVAVAMLRSRSAERRSRARRMLDVICAEALSPSGHFFDYLLPDGTWGGFSSKWPGRRPYLFMRRTLECTRDVIKAMELLRERGELVPESWQSAARRSLEAMVKTTERHGHLGYLVDPTNGDVLLGASTCGGFALEALVRGHAWFEDVRYLETAIRLARFYRERYLLAGYTCGGVADALMAVDSESNYGLLSGLVHLHEATQDPEHLAWAVEAAELFQTWVLLYDAVLPQGTPLQRLGIEPRGAVFANIQNQHGAPGIFVFSGHELAILAERTGDERWRILLREIVACIPQMVVREGQGDVWGDLPAGASSERLMTMDGLEPAGCTAQIDTFSQVVLISANELPPEVLS